MNLSSPKTPLERLNNPNSIIRIFVGLEVAAFVGTLIGVWLRSLNSPDTYLQLLAFQLPFVWVPVAIVIAIAGVILFVRAVKVSRDN